MGTSVRIRDLNEKDTSKSIAIILNEIAFDAEDNYSDFTKKIITKAKEQGKNPVITENWREN